MAEAVTDAIIEAIDKYEKKEEALAQELFFSFFALIKEGVPLFQIPSRLSSMYINLT